MNENYINKAGEVSCLIIGIGAVTIRKLLPNFPRRCPATAGRRGNLPSHLYISSDVTEPLYIDNICLIWYNYVNKYKGDVLPCQF